MENIGKNTPERESLHMLSPQEKHVLTSSLTWYQTIDNQSPFCIILQDVLP